MTIDVRTLDDPDRWDDLLADAEQPTPFHLSAALDVVADHADADCHRLVGYKGEEPVGLFPVFTISKGPVTAAFSPPPERKIPYLGPTLVVRHELKRRRRDKRHQRFIAACLDWLATEAQPSFTQIRTAPGYEDVRPFVWREFDPTPRYTYRIDLTRSTEDLLASFSSDARSNVTADYDVTYEILDGGTGGIEDIVSQVRSRHAEQNEPFPIRAGFVTDLYESLPDGVVRPKVCQVDGEFVGGNVNLEFAGAAFRWLGGAKPTGDLPANDLLDWQYARAAKERDVVTYDLTGANDARIARYKAKFAPDLVPYYQLHAGTRTMSAVARLYGVLT